MDLSSSRFVKLNSGGMIRVTEALMQGAGEQGPVGPVGPPGDATTINGTKATYAAINALLNKQQGDAWIAADTGRLWVWHSQARVFSDGTSVIQGWNDVGRIVGPIGLLQSVSAQFRKTGTPLAVPGNESKVSVAFDTVDHNDSEWVDGTTQVPIIIRPAGATFTTWTVGNSNVAGYIFDVSVRVNTTTAGRGRVRLTLLRNNVEEFTHDQLIDGVYTVEQDIQHVVIVRTKATDVWSVRVNANIDVRVVSGLVGVGRFGGGLGPQGIQGVKGSPSFYGLPITDDPNTLGLSGSQGELRYNSTTGDVWSWNDQLSPAAWINAGHFRGPVGSANGGFSQFDDLSSVGDSTVIPVAGGPVDETDQRLPLMKGSHSPQIAYFFNRAITALNSLVVGRFTSLSDWQTKRFNTGKAVRGEIFYADGPGARAGNVMVYDEQRSGATVMKMACIDIVPAGSFSGGATADPDGHLIAEV